jgi:hypothetical protein
MKSLVIVSLLALPALAHAGPAPGLTLPEGKLNLALNLEVNTSKDVVAEPVSLAPDVSYGVSDDVTAMLVHSRFLTTGFRGAAGGGLCVSGTGAGCANVYDNVGAEVLYALARGAFSAAANVGVHAISLDSGFYDAKLGARLRYSAGAVGVTVTPSVFVAMTERSDDDATTPDNPDRLWVPVVAGYTVSPELWLACGTGIKGPLDHFGDAWQLAAGVLGTYKLDPALSVGASLIFGQVAGGADTTGVDYRWTQLWVSYTR